MTEREIWVGWLVQPRSSAGYGRMLRMCRNPAGVRQWQDMVCEAADRIRSQRAEAEMAAVAQTGAVLHREGAS